MPPVSHGIGRASPRGVPTRRGVPGCGGQPTYGGGRGGCPASPHAHSMQRPGVLEAGMPHDLRLPVTASVPDTTLRAAETSLYRPVMGTRDGPTSAGSLITTEDDSDLYSDSHHRTYRLHLSRESHFERAFAGPFSLALFRWTVTRTDPAPPKGHVQKTPGRGGGGSYATHIVPLTVRPPPLTGMLEERTAYPIVF